MSEEKPPEVIKFPVQQKRSLEPTMTVEEAIQQAKLKVVGFMARVEAGTLPLDQDKLESIQWINDLCVKYGYPPLNYDFDKYLKEE